MATQRISSGFGVDTRELKSFIKALRRASPTAAHGLQVSLKAAGEIVAVRARSIASEHSTSIPPTIKAGAVGATVSVRAGKNVPLASLYELGNKAGGGGRGGDTFSHPVYGHQTTPWATQARYPFLIPAVDQTEPEVLAAIEKVADEVADVITGHLGF